MIIRHFIPTLATGGAERLVVGLAAQARASGHDVEILTLHDVTGVPRLEAKSLGIPVRVLNSTRWDLRTPLRLRAATRDADIVHVHLFPALYWGAFLTKPKIFTEHNTWNRRRDKRLLGLFERLVYAGYDRIACISLGTRDALAEHLGVQESDSRLVWISNGIGDEFFSKLDHLNADVSRVSNSESLRMIAVGSLSAQKGFDRLIELAQRLPDITIDIAGEGSLRRSLETKIANAGLTGQVRLLGAKDKVHLLLPRYDVFISSSVWEGFGLVGAEAMAAGLPVIGPDIPGFREVVPNDEAGMLFDPGNWLDDMLKAVNQMRDPQVRKGFASEGIRRAKKFRIHSTSNDYLSLYEEIIQNRGDNNTHNGINVAADQPDVSIRVGSQKSMALGEVQAESLRILDEFSSQCEELGLRYFLARGALLGSVRDGTLVPWDDDIDVMMPRPDYDKALEIWQDRAHTALLTPTRPDFPYSWAKLVSTRTFFLEPGVKPYSDYGVYLDVIPIDGTPPLFRRSWMFAVQRFRSLFKLAHVTTFSSRYSGARFRLKQAIGAVGRLVPADVYQRGLSRMLKLFPYENSGVVGEYFSAFEAGGLFPVRDLDGSSMTEIDGKSYRTFKDPVRYLRRKYGEDWATPKRRSNAQHGQAYWRTNGTEAGSVQDGIL